MRKICLTVVGMYLTLLHAFSQVSYTDSSGYKSRKLKMEEVNLVSSYYNQTADKSAVMGGRTDSKGNGDVTDLANGLDVKQPAFRYEPGTGLRGEQRVFRILPESGRDVLITYSQSPRGDVHLGRNDASDHDQ